MLISMILDPEACISDAGFFSVGPTDQRTDGQGDSRSWMMHVCMMHVCMMHISMTLDLDACVYVAYIFFPDPDVFRYDACVYDAYIYGP